MAGLSWFVTYLLCLGWPRTPMEFIVYGVCGPVSFALVAAVVFTGIGLHHAVWRHVSTGEIVAIVEASALAILAHLLLICLVDRLGQIPRAAPLIQWPLLVVLLGTSRLSWRLMSEQERWQLAEPGRELRMLLVGTGKGCDMLLRGIASGAATAYRAVGIVDPVGRNVGCRIHGTSILGSTADLGDVVARLENLGQRPAMLVLTEPIGRFALREPVSQAESLRLETVRLPRLVEFRAALSEGRVAMQPIPVVELLGRDQVQLDHGAIEELIAGQRVLITGAGGSIGSELVRLVAALRPAHLTLIDHSEFNMYAIDHELDVLFPNTPRTVSLADVRDRTRIHAIFEKERPELVVHAAALKHVPMVEVNPIAGVLTNVIGTHNVADAADAVRVRAMVQISTDKAVNPSSIMGATKRLAELYCQALDLATAPSDAGRLESTPRFFTVRFGNVLGSSGSVIPLFQQQLSDGGPLTVTHPEMRRFFMTIREASELVLHASACGLRDNAERGEIFVLDMGEPVRIVDVARQIIRLAGKNPDKDIGITFVGLRPGEKLFEELFDDHEVRLSSLTPGVLVARSATVELSTLRELIAELAEACARQDEVHLSAALVGSVPGYGERRPQSEAAVPKESEPLGERGDPGLLRRQRQLEVIGEEPGKGITGLLFPASDKHHGIVRVSNG